MKDKAIFRSYLKNLHKIMMQGDAREESFYSALEALFNAYANASNKRDIYVTTLPKKTEAGYPDFRIWDGKQHVVGYIEAKHPNERNLQLVSESEQLKRYRHTFPNLILTNFFEFRLYRDGDLVESVQIARPLISTRLEKVPPLEKVDEFIGLLEKFFAFLLPKSYSAESLATELAKRTRFLRDEVISQELAQERERGTGDLLGFYEAFQTYLIGGLTHEDFADLYAQTITYGLFAARVRVGDGFNRRTAFDAIPHTIGILRDLFRFISLGDLPKPLECNVDDIAEVLAIADVQGILHRYFHSGGEVEKLTTPPKGKGSDPIVHFYETFLKHYDPKERERRGVYYTPEPVVSYIVRSLHAILKEKFGKADGLASEGVTLLDPAAGTMTFVAKAAQVAVEEFVGKYGEGSRESFIRDQILRNFYAFELMMAPYAVGHLKMAFFLEELGYRLKPEERVKFYLTNTLETEELAEAKLPGLSSLAQESHEAGKVKKEIPILVVLGNPPYSVSSENKSDFIEGLMDDYKQDLQGERNIQPLSDDYIKFIRFAHWKLDQADKGVLGFITNNSYLSGIIHRGMRRKLMETFDEIYLLNLHGSSRIGEKTPEGSKDKNVFDIQQGVAIALYVKLEKPLKEKRIYYADLWGLRDKKYDNLYANDVSTTQWQELEPVAPYYFFVPKDFALQMQYEKFWRMEGIFRERSFGVTTSRDHFVVGFTKNGIIQRLRIFTSNLSDELVKEALKLKDTGTWKVSEARREAKGLKLEDKIYLYAHRPYDTRWICYGSPLIERDRSDIMQHVLNRENLGLDLTRRLRDPVWRHVYVTSFITDKTLLSSRDNCYFFPLYFYPSEPQEQLLGKREAKVERIPNFTTEFLGTIRESLNTEPPPEEVFYFIYAVLYSNVYRKRYAEFLRIDFPRIPFTKDVKLFQKLAALGGRLVDLHLLRSSELDPPIARFQGEGDNRVQIGKKGLRYDSEKQWAYINEAQFFEDVPPEVWEYQIGGYQVCHKWLKDRKDRTLSLEDIKTYCRIVTALEKTIEAQAKIDKLYPKVEETLLPIKL